MIVAKKLQIKLVCLREVTGNNSNYDYFGNQQSEIFVILLNRVSFKNMIRFDKYAFCDY